MFDRTQIQAAEQAWYACPHQTWLIRGCPNEQNIAHQTREQKNVLRLMATNFIIKHDQTTPNKVSKR